MTFYAPNEDCAHRACAYLNAKYKPGLLFDGDRVLTRYIVERYAMPDGRYKHKDFRHEWGVVARWRYKDRPDLSEMGGGFTTLTGEMWA